MPADSSSWEQRLFFAELSPTRCHAMTLIDPMSALVESTVPVVPPAGDSRVAGPDDQRESGGGPLSVREVNALKEIEPYAADWNGLLDQTPGASYFHSFDWFATYWRHFGASQRMRMILVLDSAGIVGVVPLVVLSEQTSLGGLRSLRYPLHGWGSFYGPIGCQPRSLLRAAIDHILRTRRDWDMLDMLWVDRDGRDGVASARALKDLHLPFRARPWLETSQIEINGDWQSYWNSRKSHWRTNVRRCERRLLERGDVELVRYRPLGAAHAQSDPRWDLYDECERIAANSWQGASTTGTTLSHESVRSYLRAAHVAAAQFGGVDINLLLLNGRPAAFAYNYHFRGYIFGLRSGYDAKVCTEGAGTVLQRLLIEDSCQRGDRVIDMGPGSLEAKRHWQTRLATAWRYTHYSGRSPRAQLLRMLHLIKDARDDLRSRGKEGGR
jgi:CelD/BcsL family acetyltransferase involved in cellulose biosynthesis